jgi:hypothetical protein
VVPLPLELVARQVLAGRELVVLCVCWWQLESAWCRTEYELAELRVRVAYNVLVVGKARTGSMVMASTTVFPLLKQIQNFRA